MSRFAGSRYFSTRRRYVDNYGDLERAIDRRRGRLMGLVIPRDFAQRLDCRPRTRRCSAIVDGSDSNTATIALGYAEVVTAAFYSQDRVEQIRRAAGAPAGARPRRCGRASGSTRTWSRGTTSFPA